VEAAVGDVFLDADHEVVFRFGFFEVVQYRFGHGRGEFLGTQAVAAADDGGVAFEAEFAVGHGFADGGADVQVERFTQGAGLFGAVQDGDAFDGFGEGLDEGLQGEGTVEVDLDHADLFTLFDQVVDGFLDGVGGGTHDDDDPFGVFGAGVVDQFVFAAGEFAEFVHFFLDDFDAGFVVLVDGFTPLEVDVRVLGGAAHDGPVGGEAAQAVGVDQFVADHGAHVVKAEFFHFLDFVGGAEAVEEVQEGDPRAQGGALGDQGEVHDFLDVVGAEHGPAGGAAGHDVGVVAEDVEGGGGDGAGRDVEDGGGQLPGALVHVRDHEQQTLAGGKGGGEGSGLQGAMDGAGSAPFGLQFGHQRDGAPDVLLTRGALGVGDLAHDR